MIDRTIEFQTSKDLHEKLYKCIKIFKKDVDTLMKGGPKNHTYFKFNKNESWVSRRDKVDNMIKYLNIVWDINTKVNTLDFAKCVKEGKTL